MADVNVRDGHPSLNVYVRLPDERVFLAGDYLEITENLKGMYPERFNRIIAKAKAKSEFTYD